MLGRCAVHLSPFYWGLGIDPWSRGNLSDPPGGGLGGGGGFGPSVRQRLRREKPRRSTTRPWAPSALARVLVLGLVGPGGWCGHGAPLRYSAVAQTAVAINWHFGGWARDQGLRATPPL